MVSVKAKKGPVNHVNIPLNVNKVPTDSLNQIESEAIELGIISVGEGTGATDVNFEQGIDFDKKTPELNEEW